ncbi:MAG: helix-turn-helix transcriptional regulator [Planctomycetes bacterium]|nr:helix-turn-helix transcriptional regulator [Planctomycetota bacterium]
MVDPGSPGSVPSYPANLAEPPQIDQIGVGIHRPTEDGRWCLPGRWCLHLYTYPATLTVNGVTLEIRPGYAGICPEGGDLHYRFQTKSVHTFAHFRLRGHAEGSMVALPAMQDLGAGFDAMQSAFQEAIGWRATAPARAASRLWEILWELSARTPTASAESAHPALERARHHIEIHLGERLSVEALAAHAGCSHNHLTRLFQRDLGRTVVGYIRDRRVQRARHLLRHSTMAIKAIAADVGIPDPHLFNKVIRRELGKPPSAVRRDRR